MLRPSLRTLVRPLLCALPLAALLVRPLPAAEAKLEGAEWKQVETEMARLFTPLPGKPGFGADKLTLVELLLKDGEARSWRMLSDVLVGECTLWLDAHKAVRETEDKIFPTLRKATKDRTKEEEEAMFKAQAALPALEETARTEREVLDKVVQAVAGAPAALKQNLFGRAKGPADWFLRAAVAQVAAADPLEKDSAAFLVRSLAPSSEKDPRVRAAALYALMPFPEGAEEHVIGRLADPDWTVQILALRIVKEKKVTRAIPHLIATLERANPRMQEELGVVLKELTGENFDAFADVWARWWEENKAKFEGKEIVKVGARPSNPAQDPTLYGLPIKSDRVLFIIDISGSMKDPTKNDNDKPPPTGAVTPKDGEKPVEPPEQLMSGPKIDVAKHELKKAIEKLPKTAKFSMIAYNHATLVWKDVPVDASPANKEDAYKWIRDFKPSGSTYTDGALRTAFRIAGLGAIDKAYPEVLVDTIVLVSDGAPTDNAPDASKLMDHSIILQHVREWNAQKRVVIHCIAVDMTHGNDFMQKLAAENGGHFVDR